MSVQGITYKNTYYILPAVAEDLRLHFHELVHVLQWAELGDNGFISRYIDEIHSYGYDSAPLEKMAYALDNHFINGGRLIDVQRYVTSNINV